MAQVSVNDLAALSRRRLSSSPLHSSSTSRDTPRRTHRFFMSDIFAFVQGGMSPRYACSNRAPSTSSLFLPADTTNVCKGLSPIDPREEQTHEDPFLIWLFVVRQASDPVRTSLTHPCFAWPVSRVLRLFLQKPLSARICHCESVSFLEKLGWSRGGEGVLSDLVQALAMKLSVISDGRSGSPSVLSEFSGSLCATHCRLP